ncbi:hypothetical protein DM02DRAFT_335684 [Periconia macrospinosa]|uniref:Concanavalin A-like lectin/glucanase n=1 Tax=Periconia macrospinosa TaxID=97972 RepID=A0A2V1DU11_9PLEO|nr:hypothetical protein DM02DRAFT_335684 [Periconia macrospinosa]
MFSILQGTLLAALLPAAVLCAPQKRAAAAPTEPFELYAYGTKIGGMPMFFNKGLAFAGNPSKTADNDSYVEQVSFVTGDDDSWVASPVNKTAEWSGSTLFIPSKVSNDTRIGFLPPSNGGNSSIDTTGFSFYGNTVLRIEDDGTMDMLFTALVIDSETIQLYWNDTSSGQVPVTLRSVAPTSPPPSVPATPLQPATTTSPQRRS